jgi:hypothetical protein
MSVRYHLRRGGEVPDYQCMRECLDRAASRCLVVPGTGVDAAIGQLLLDTLTPLALEVALSVQTELQASADHADALRRHNVERAQHRADLARRRYLAVDPDNRLVADSLEADRNDAQRAVQTAQDDYEKAAAAAAPELTDEHKQLNVHKSTIKGWHRTGLLISHKANDKNVRLFEPPTPGDQRLVLDKAARSETEFEPNPRQEVQCETQALSRADPTLPVDCLMPSRVQESRNSRAVYSLPWMLCAR